MRNNTLAFLRSLAVLLAAIGFTGCAHSIHQYSALDASRDLNSAKGRVITAESEQFVILSIAFNTDYADKAYQKLLESCPKGEIMGINSRYSTSMSFLSYTNKMRLEAVCLE